MDYRKLINDNKDLDVFSLNLATQLDSELNNRSIKLSDEKFNSAVDYLKTIYLKIDEYEITEYHLVCAFCDFIEEENIDDFYSIDKWKFLRSL